MTPTLAHLTEWLRQYASPSAPIDWDDLRDRFEADWDAGDVPDPD